MASHRAQAQFDRARWRLILLLPLWVLQLSLTLSLAGLFAYRLGDSIKFYEDRHKLEGLWPKLEIIWESTNIGMSAIATLCTLVEIARYVGEALTPWTMLFTHIIKLTCAGGVLALDIVVHIQGIDKQYSTIGLALDAAFLATALTLAVYSIIAYRRLVAFDDHPHTANAKGYGFNDGAERRSSYTAMLGSIRPSMEKRHSSTSSRISWRREEHEHMALDDLEHQPTSYIHERDTQFDQYVARKSSVGSPHERERHLSADFGWDSNPFIGTLKPAKEPEEGEDRVIALGVVKSRPRGASMPRVLSWSSENVLVAVPEEEDHGEENSGPRDRQALLGHDRTRSDESIRVDGRGVPQDAGVTDMRWQRE